jgi:hypothetical protein
MSEQKPASEADFRTILEAALRARSEEEASVADTLIGGYRVADPDIHDAIEQLLSSPAYVPVGRLAQMYADEQSGRRLEKARNLDQFLADELCLSSDLSTEDLKRLRREFAIYNHPDRVTSADRERATRRMTLVNVLIDKALKEKKGEAAADD